MRREEWKLGLRVLTEEATPQDRQRWEALLRKKPALLEESEKLRSRWERLLWPAAQPVFVNRAKVRAALTTASPLRLGRVLRPALAACALAVGFVGGWSLRPGGPAEFEPWGAWQEMDSFAWVYLEEASGDRTADGMMGDREP